MEQLLKWIIENKELVFLLAIISISVPISIRFGRTIINNIYTTKHYDVPKSNENSKSNNSSRRKYKSSNVIEVNKILLYSKGAKGKVYTRKIYKQINSNFGIEIHLKNNTNKQQNIKVGWCIYKKGKEILKRTFNVSVSANTTLSKSFHVGQENLKSLPIGKYKSQCWVNNRRVQKVYFYIYNM